MKLGLLPSALFAFAFAGCAMHSTTSSLYEFPYRQATHVTPILWANVTDLSTRGDSTTYRLVIEAYNGSKRTELLRREFILHQKPLESFERLSRDTARCVLRTRDGAIIASFKVTYRDDRFSIT
jgi:hypothetical protein